MFHNCFSLLQHPAMENPSFFKKYSKNNFVSPAQSNSFSSHLKDKIILVGETSTFQSEILPVEEPFTGSPGKWVRLQETVKRFQIIFLEMKY
jgi:hypothetical protein